MISEYEIRAEIEKLENAPSSYANCQKLANLYSVIDHMNVERKTDDCNINLKQIKSPFIELINGKDMQRVWALVDELVNTIAWTNGKLYDSFMARLKQL